MVLPVSGFLPVPLPMMIPFMGAQSLVIGKMFGEGFQYGKRKISAMPNEEFNKLTFEAMMSNARDEMQRSIPTMQQAMKDMQPMVETVVHEFIDYLKLVLDQAQRELPGLGEMLSKQTTGLSGGIVGAIYELLKTQGVSLADVQKLISDAVPSLPGAGAHTGSIQLTDISKPSTIKGLSISEARKQALEKQLIHEENLSATRKFGEALAETKQPKPQIPLGWKVRPADQTRRMERIRLIKKINNMRNNISTLKKRGKVPTSLVVNFRKLQQNLVNILAMWRF